MEKVVKLEIDLADSYYLITSLEDQIRLLNDVIEKSNLNFVKISLEAKIGYLTDLLEDLKHEYNYKMNLQKKENNNE